MKPTTTNRVLAALSGIFVILSFLQAHFQFIPIFHPLLIDTELLSYTRGWTGFGVSVLVSFLLIGWFWLVAGELDGSEDVINVLIAAPCMVVTVMIILTTLLGNMPWTIAFATGHAGVSIVHFVIAYVRIKRLYFVDTEIINRFT